MQLRPKNSKMIPGERKYERDYECGNCGVGFSRQGISLHEASCYRKSGLACPIPQTVNSVSQRRQQQTDCTNMTSSPTTNVNLHCNVNQIHKAVSIWAWGRWFFSFFMSFEHLSGWGVV